MNVCSVCHVDHAAEAMANAKLWNMAGGGAPQDGAPGRLGNHWYKITNIGQNAAEIWVYAEIGMWGITAEGLVSELAALNVADITVHLNSPGGDVFDGIAIMNALRDHPAYVTVKVDALAASIASVIAQAGNKIIMGRNSTMMIHNASGYAQGEAEDLEKMATLLRSTTENIANVYTERAGGKAKDWLAAMKEETWYTADEAVAAGLADEVAPMPTEREAHQQAAKFDLSVYNHAPIIEPDVELDELAILPFRTVAQAEEDADTIAWDPDAFKNAMAEALPEPVTWDPNLFRAAVDSVINNAPAVTPTKPPEPTPVTGFDPTIFAQAMRDVNK